MDKALLSVLILSFIQTTYSCSCVRFDMNSQLCTPDLVFLGTAISEKAPSSPDTVGDRVYTFRIKEIFWARNELTGIGQSLNVSTRAQSSLCDVRLQLNTVYVISAYSSSGKWGTTSCMFRRLWSTVPQNDRIFLSDTLKKNCAQQVL